MRFNWWNRVFTPRRQHPLRDGVFLRLEQTEDRVLRAWRLEEVRPSLVSANQFLRGAAR